MKQSEQLSDMEHICKTLRKEMSILKDALNGLRGSGVAAASIASAVDSFECDDIERWAQLLPQAKVTRWGGMISTPDSSLQESVRKALLDSLCPPNVVNELMANSHERRWPPGLSTLEIRQMNRRIYENYVCRKIPGKQAVVVMSCDNTHVTEEMILDPGLVMIFAHGIE
jgi:E3 ubiquitin-protein ligase NRDP1